MKFSSESVDGEIGAPTSSRMGDEFHFVWRKRETKWILQTSLILLLLCAGDIATGETTDGSSPLTDNYLFEGCSIKDELKVTTFAKSHHLTLKFPPPVDFRLSVQTSNDDRHLLQFDPILSSKDEWIDMELLLEDQIQLVFPNGSVWEPRIPMTPMARFPEKVIRGRFGNFLDNCPQRRPNWKLEKDLTPKTVKLMEGSPEVFSLSSSVMMIAYFTLGQEELVLCWNDSSKKLRITREDDKNIECEGLPPHRNHWLEVLLQDEMIKISDPSRNGSLLRSFALQSTEGQLTFKGKTGVTFVVHHLQGFPDIDPKRKHVTGTPTPVAQKIKKDPLEMKGHMLVYVMGGVAGVLLVLLIASVILARMYHKRWTKLKQILMLLRNMKPKETAESNTYGKTTGPVMPTDAPPLPPGIDKGTEGIYLVPREVLPQETSRIRSEHLYESLEELGIQKEIATPSTNIENQGFDG